MNSSTYIAIAIKVFFQTTIWCAGIYGFSNLGFDVYAYLHHNVSHLDKVFFSPGDMLTASLLITAARVHLRGYALEHEISKNKESLEKLNKVEEN